MFFAVGLFDGSPAQKGEKYERCALCGFVGMQPVFKRHRWLMLLFIPVPVETQIYTQCPRCGGIKAMTKQNFNNEI